RDVGRQHRRLRHLSLRLQFRPRRRLAAGGFLAAQSRPDRLPRRRRRQERRPLREARSAHHRQRLPLRETAVRRRRRSPAAARGEVLQGAIRKDRPLVTLILIRHAAPIVDPSTPPSQWPLSREGRAAARSLSLPTNAYLVASTEPKAIQT